MCQHHLYENVMENFLNLLYFSGKNKGVSPENSTLFIRKGLRTITSSRETISNDTNT